MPFPKRAGEMRVTATPFRASNKTRSFLARHCRDFSPMCQARYSFSTEARRNYGGLAGCRKNPSSKATVGAGLKPTPICTDIVQVREAYCRPQDRRLRTAGGLFQQPVTRGTAGGGCVWIWRIDTPLDPLFLEGRDGFGYRLRGVSLIEEMSRGVVCSPLSGGAGGVLLASPLMTPPCPLGIEGNDPGSCYAGC
jgi:hypothetical protein